MAGGGKIFVRNGNGRPEPVEEARFDSEDKLQELVATYPELLAGEQMDPEDPRRWILVKREKGIADRPDAADRWSVDHLMIDQDAVPTLIEAKRSLQLRDTEKHCRADVRLRSPRNRNLVGR